MVIQLDKLRKAYNEELEKFFKKLFVDFKDRLSLSENEPIKFNETEVYIGLNNILSRHELEDPNLAGEEVVSYNFNGATYDADVSFIPEIGSKAYIITLNKNEDPRHVLQFSIWYRR